MTLVSYTPNERQLTLLEFIIVRGAVAREDIVASLPAYAQGSAIAIQRKIERDLDYLRGCGYPIATDSANRYLYDRNVPLLANVSALDVGLLRSVLTEVRTRGPLFSAASTGLSKLLASSPAQIEETKYLQANIPSGDSALFLARAIQHHRRVQFDYQSSHHEGVRTYLLEPVALEEQYDVYFVSGPASAAGQWSWRTFRTTRIVQGTLRVVGNAEQDRTALPDRSYFSYSDVVLEIRPGCAAPLVSRGRHMNGNEYLYREVNRNALFEALATYGADVQLLAPIKAVKDWRARLAHLRSLGGVHG